MILEQSRLGCRIPSGMGTAPAPRTAASTSPCDVKRNCQRCRWFRAAKGRGMRPQSKRHCAACGTYLRPTARFDDWHGGNWTPEEAESFHGRHRAARGHPARSKLKKCFLDLRRRRRDKTHWKTLKLSKRAHLTKFCQKIVTIYLLQN